MREHILTNARTIVAVMDGTTDLGCYGNLYTALGRARDWGGQLSMDDIESLLTIVSDYIPDSQQ